MVGGNVRSAMCNKTTTEMLCLALTNQGGNVKDKKCPQGFMRMTERLDDFFFLEADSKGSLW